MRSLGLIIRRELACYVHTPLGVIVGSCVLLADGLLFNAFALGSGKRFSSEVLEDFFYFSSGTTVIAALFLAMRLLAEERQRGTISLLFSSPVSEWQIVLGKFFSAQLFLSLLTLATLYMPALIFVNGRVSLGHIAAGYLGLLLLGAAALAVGTFASAVARTQVAAAMLASALIVTFLIFWLLSRIVDPPLNDVLSYLALWDKHFPPFMRGVVSARGAAYYLSVAFFFLLASVRVLESRRWR